MVPPAARSQMMEREAHRIVADLIVIPPFSQPAINPSADNCISRPTPTRKPPCHPAGLQRRETASEQPQSQPLQPWTSPLRQLYTPRERAGSEVLANPVWLLGLLFWITLRKSLKLSPRAYLVHWTRYSCFLPSSASFKSLRKELLVTGPPCSPLSTSHLLDTIATIPTPPPFQRQRAQRAAVP